MSARPPPSTRGIRSVGKLSTLEAAHAYHHNGWTPIAIHFIAEAACSCGDTSPEHLKKSAGKHPVATGWQRSHGQTEEAMAGQWTDRRGAHEERYGVGLAMGGPHRLVALDVDGDLGRRSLGLLEEAFGALPETLTSRSGSGGEHRIFTVPPALDLSAVRNRANMLGADFLGEGEKTGLDVRAEGGQVVAAPSMHRSGRRYTWTNDTPIGELPVWLFDLMAPPPAAPLPAAPIDYGRAGDTGQILRRASAYLATLAPAVSGQGGHLATYRAALVAVRGFGLGARLGLDVLRAEHNPRCDPPWTEKELEHKVKQALKSTRVGWGYLLDDPKRRRLDELPPALASLPSDPHVPVVLIDNEEEAKAYAALAAPQQLHTVALGGRWFTRWAAALRGRSVRVAVHDQKLAYRLLRTAARAGARSTTWARPRGTTTWAAALERRTA